MVSPTRHGAVIAHVVDAENRDEGFLVEPGANSEALCEGPQQTQSVRTAHP